MKPTVQQLERRDLPAPLVVVDVQTLLPHDEVRRLAVGLGGPVRVVTDPAAIPRGAWRIYLEDGHADDLFVGQQTLTRSPVRVDAAVAYDRTLSGRRTRPVGFVSVAGVL